MESELGLGGMGASQPPQELSGRGLGPGLQAVQTVILLPELDASRGLSHTSQHLGPEHTGTRVLWGRAGGSPGGH